MIYLRIKNRLDEILYQVSYAEKLSKKYGQDIKIYYNGSYQNFRNYYEKFVLNCGLFDKYEFVDKYPQKEEVLFEKAIGDYFRYLVETRLSKGKDVVIEGDFHKSVNIDDVKEIFNPSKALLEHVKTKYNPTKQSISINMEPNDKRVLDEFVVAPMLLKNIVDKYSGETYDKIFILTNHSSFFDCTEIREILSGLNAKEIIFVDEDGNFGESIKLMIPYFCGTNVINNEGISWMSHLLNPYDDKKVDIFYPCGASIVWEDFPENYVQNKIWDFCNIVNNEKLKQQNGEDSVFDGVAFED